MTFRPALAALAASAVGMAQSAAPSGGFPAAAAERGHRRGLAVPGRGVFVTGGPDGGARPEARPEWRAPNLRKYSGSSREENSHEMLASVGTSGYHKL